VSDQNPYQAPTAPIGTGAAFVDAAPCPRCGGQQASKAKFTWWGGALGPKLFHVVRCGQCRTQYNGRTGGKLTRVIVVYQLVAVALIGLITWAWLTNMR
jgi:hypothetical protein